MGDGPDIGVGSAGWYAKQAKYQVMAAGVGAFLGKIVGRFMDTGPTFTIAPTGELVISTKQGLTVIVEAAHVRALSLTIHRDQCRFHLGTSDADLSENVEP